MKQLAFKLIIALALMLGMTDQAFAITSIEGFTPAYDKSIEYLGIIFGEITAMPIEETPFTPLIKSIFFIFNIAVLTLCSFVVSYTIILSTINTAQEGEVMGRKWSSIWIPLRCTVGVGFLLPGLSGYSVIQWMMLKIILMGVDAANLMWATAVKFIEPPTSINKKINPSSTIETTKKIFEGLVCAEAFNHDPTCRTAINNQIVSVYQKNNKIYIGVENDPRYHNLCGSFAPGSVPRYIDGPTWYQTNLSALLHTAYQLQPSAQGVYHHNEQGLGILDRIVKSANHFGEELKNIAINREPDKKDVSNYLDYGWLFAGSYYFDFSNNKERTLHYNPPTAERGILNNVGESAIKQYNLHNKKAMDSYKYDGGLDIVSGASKLTEDAPAIAQQVYESIKDNITSMSSLSAIGEAFSNKFSSAANYILSPFSKAKSLYDNPIGITEGDNDPISNLREWGNLITGTTETLFGVYIFVAFSLMALSCTGVLGLFTSPVCTMVNGILGLISVLFIPVVGLLWSTGILLSLYVPMIPYLIFTFTALGWFILVIEAIVAAPIVALGLASPAQDMLGKAAPAVMIIASVFLRPSLMIVGFIVGIALVKASITMVSFGFQLALQALLPAAEIGANIPLGGMGIFKSIVLIVVYTGMVIMIIHECFSLIYLLPDKIIRWIGHSAEQSSVKASVQEVRESTDKGSESASGLMKGISSHVIEKIQEKVKEKCKEIQVGGTSSPPPPATRNT